MTSFDITFCDNENCKKRKTCERRTERLKNYPYPVSMSHFEPDEDGTCDEYFEAVIYKPKKYKKQTAREKADALFVEFLMANKGQSFSDWLKEYEASKNI